MFTFTALAALAVSLALQAPPPAPTAPIPTRSAAPSTITLGDACTKTVAAKSYAFDYASDVSTGAGGGEQPGASGAKRAAAGNKGEADVAITGASQLGSPVLLRRGALEAYRLDQQMVYRRGEGTNATWEVFDPTDPGNGMPGTDGDGKDGKGRRDGKGGDDRRARRRRGAQGGDDGAGDGDGGGDGKKGGLGGGDEPKQPGTPAGGGALVPGSTPATGMMLTRTLSQIAGLPVPVELLQKADASMSDVTREESGGKVQFRGTLDPKAAEEFSGMAGTRRLARQMGMPGGAGLKVSATMTVVVGALGLVEEMKVDATIVGGARGDQKRTITYKLHDFDATKYEVPKAALAKLST